VASGAKIEMAAAVATKRRKETMTVVDWKEDVGHVIVDWKEDVGHVIVDWKEDVGHVMPIFGLRLHDVLL
jgi:hypothetical protein